MRLLDLHLDRHPVAVPAGHVRRIEPRHRPALDDDVLQDLVERMPDVDVGVRVRRAVVQHEARAPGATPRGSPRRLCFCCHSLHPARLAPGEIAAHRKRRVGQIQRRLVIGFRIVGHAVSCRFDRRQGQRAASSGVRRVAGEERRAPARHRLDAARECFEVRISLLVAQLVQKFDDDAAAVDRLRRNRR